jgi:hypothetical protein
MPTVTIQPTPIYYGDVLWSIQHTSNDKLKSTSNDIVPIVYGRVQLAGKIIYAADSILTNNLGGVQNDIYKFKPALWFLLCYGQIILRETIVDGIGNINTAYPTLWDVKNDGTQNTYPPIPYGTKLPGIAHVYSESKQNTPIVTTGDKLPDIKFIVERVITLAGDDCSILESGGTGVVVAHTAAGVIYDLLSNSLYGLGLTSTDINTTSFKEANVIQKANGIGLSFVIDSALEVREVIENILEICDCALYLDDNGKFAIKQFDVTDCNTIAEIITDEDIIEIDIKRDSYYDTFNIFKTKFAMLPPSTNYLTANQNALTVDKSFVWKNEANIYMQGKNVSRDINLDMIGQYTIAEKLFYQKGKYYSYPRTRISLTTSRKHANYNIGDIILMVLTNYGISQNFRVINKPIPAHNENTITLELEDDIYAMFDTNYVATTPIEPASPDITIPVSAENLTFPAFSGTSTLRGVVFTTDADSVVIWGNGQEQKGTLTYGTDYTVLNHNQIVLDPVIFADDIQANALGLLNVDTWQG